MKTILGLLVLWWFGAAMVCCAVLKSSKAKDARARKTSEALLNSRLPRVQPSSGIHWQLRPKGFELPISARELRLSNIG